MRVRVPPLAPCTGGSELVDIHGSEPWGRKAVRVRVPPCALLADVAQLAVQALRKRKVGGSTPLVGSTPAWRNRQRSAFVMRRLQVRLLSLAPDFTA